MVDSLKAFLPGCIPYLELEFTTVDCNALDLEVDSNRRYVAGFEVGFTISEKKVGLSDARVSNDKQFGSVAARFS